MYQYLWDEETGGLLLTTEQSKFSKEPRPVYASELTILDLTNTGRIPKTTALRSCGQKQTITYIAEERLPELKAVHTIPNQR